MKAPDTIGTARLELRRPRAGDAEAIFVRYASDREVTRFLSWPAHRSLDDTRAFLAFSDAEWERWPAGPYLVFTRADGALVGGTGLKFDTREDAMAGYVFARDAWGHGYATESTRAIVDVASHCGVRRLYALCHPAHAASAHVLEKCGFTREGVVSRCTELPNLAPGCPSDMLRYVLVLGRERETGRLP